MLTYVDGAPRNVWAENADGSQRRQVTTDADGDHQYLFPSANDAGEYGAARRQTDGQPGARLPRRQQPHRQPPAGLGPRRDRPAGDADRAPPAASSRSVFGRFHGAGQSIAGKGVVPADAPGSPTGPGPGFPRMRSVTWHGDKLVWSSESATFWRHRGGDDGVAQRRHERRGLARRPGACLRGSPARRRGVAYQALKAEPMPAAPGRGRRRLLRAVHGRAVRRGAVAERRPGRLPRRRRPARRAGRDPPGAEETCTLTGRASILRDRRRPGLLERDADHHPAAARRRRSKPPGGRRPRPTVAPGPQPGGDGRAPAGRGPRATVVRSRRSRPR